MLVTYLLISDSIKAPCWNAAGKLFLTAAKRHSTAPLAANPPEYRETKKSAKWGQWNVKGRQTVRNGEEEMKRKKFSLILGKKIHRQHGQKVWNIWRKVRKKIFFKYRSAISLISIKILLDIFLWGGSVQLWYTVEDRVQLPLLISGKISGCFVL